MAGGGVNSIRSREGDGGYRGQRESIFVFRKRGMKRSSGVFLRWSLLHPQPGLVPGVEPRRRGCCGPLL